MSSQRGTERAIQIEEIWERDRERNAERWNLSSDQAQLSHLGDGSCSPERVRARFVAARFQTPGSPQKRLYLLVRQWRQHFVVGHLPMTTLCILQVLLFIASAIAIYIDAADAGGPGTPITDPRWAEIRGLKRPLNIKMPQRRWQQPSLWGPEFCWSSEQRSAAKLQSLYSFHMPPQLRNGPHCFASRNCHLAFQVSQYARLQCSNRLSPLAILSLGKPSQPRFQRYTAYTLIETISASDKTTVPSPNHRYKAWSKANLHDSNSSAEFFL